MFAYRRSIDVRNRQRMAVEISSVLPIIDNVDRLAALRDATQW